MSERQPKGFIPPEIAEKCKVLGPNGGPCKLFQKTDYFYCQVKVRIDQYAMDISIRKDFGSQIPDNCPQNYHKSVKR